MREALPALQVPAPLQAAHGTRRAESSTAVAASRFQEWEAPSIRAVLEQAATEGAIEEQLLSRLRGAEEVEGEEADDAAAGGDLVECALPDLVLTAELCSARRVRDFVLFSALADRLAAEAPQASPDELRRIATAFSTLGVLNTPLFQALGKAFLEAWPEGKGAPPIADLVEVSRCFSMQRMRHEELFDRVRGHLEACGVDAMTPAEALSLLYSHSFLRLADELGNLWPMLEERAAPADLEALGLDHASQLCYVLVLSRLSDARPEDLCQKLETVAKLVLAAEDGFWLSGKGLTLHRRILLLRTVVRYLHKDSYRSLSADVVKAFRRIHRMDLPAGPVKPAVAFTRKLSYILTKMRIGNAVNVETGGLTFDIVERDRKLVYECNHFDRFYVGTLEKIESMCLQERLVKAMGYRVVQVPHWQWNKILHRRQRAEYLRMSRYYAIKDRRELAPRSDAPEDIAVNEFDHLGEYFFRKERPSSAWSWFQPRYDAKRRLPEYAGDSNRAGPPPQ